MKTWPKLLKHHWSQRFTALVALLIACWILSFPAAMFFAWLRCPAIMAELSSAASLRGSSRKLSRLLPPPMPAFNASHLGQLDHLIVVCGHAVLVRLEELEKAASEDDFWYLLPYQRHHDAAETFVAHIQRGVAAAAADPRALLVFSGGETRAEAGPRSEALSYWLVAEHNRWWREDQNTARSSKRGSDGGRDGSGKKKRGSWKSGGGAELVGGLDVRGRTVVEDYARDSFENLLFSIARFREVTGRYPSRFTVVGYDFKAERFRRLHRRALRIPDSAPFEYLGVHPRGSSRFPFAAAAAGEHAHAAVPFTADPYGCSDPVLAEKRAARNPFRRATPRDVYSASAPEMKEILAWCGPGLFPIASGEYPPWVARSTGLAAAAGAPL